MVRYPLINWSVDTVDWKPRDSSKIVEKIAPELKGKGYQLVTISQLAKARSKGALKAGVVDTQFK